MEMVVFCGPQASGKTSFYNQHFSETHLRLNLDMLRTRRREAAIMDACLGVGQKFVVDNTNPTVADRARYIELARRHRFKAVAYFFDIPLEVCLQRNARRSGKARIPERGMRATFGKLDRPTIEEGFAEVHCVENEGSVTTAARASS